MKRWAIVGVIVIAVVVGALVARDWYFNDKPLDLADEYRTDAVDSAGRITGSMDRVYDSFDAYLLASTIPRGSLRNIDNVDELRRRLIPVLDDSDAALLKARKRVTMARKQIAEDKDGLLETPTATFISDSQPIDETEDVADLSSDYMRRVDRYLASYGKYLDYEKDNIDLQRRELEIAVQNDLPADASLEEIEASVDSQLEETKSLLKRRQELKPARDTEDLHDNAVEYLNVTIDYLERVQAGIDALDAPALRAADADYIDEVRRVGRQSSVLLAKLSSDSGLSEAARSLSERADELEDAAAATGRGPERDEPPRKRPPPFPAPGEGGKSGGGEGSGGGQQA